MATPEARRHDLYTRLIELLGEDRARTLMAYLPTYHPDEVATKADAAALRSEFGDLRSEFGDLRSEFGALRSEFGDLRSELRSDLADLRSEVTALGMRMDDRFHRLTLTLVAGLFVIVAAMAGVVAASLV